MNGGLEMFLEECHFDWELWHSQNMQTAEKNDFIQLGSRAAVHTKLLGENPFYSATKSLDNLRSMSIHCGLM